MTPGFDGVDTGFYGRQSKTALGIQSVGTDSKGTPRKYLEKQKG